MASDWVEEHAGRRPEGGAIVLDAEGLTARSDGIHIRARWEQVFGVALVVTPAPARAVLVAPSPDGAVAGPRAPSAQKAVSVAPSPDGAVAGPRTPSAQKAFILLPRRPPAPPWVTVTRAQLPGEAASLEILAAQIRERMQQRGYRSGGPSQPLLDPDTLLRRVLAREDVPGALEVPVGAGPGGWWRRSVDLMASGTAGGLAGLYAGAFTGNLAVAIAASAVGAAVGASAPLALASSFEGLRARRRRPRVLVLAPDGCVVGLPTGPAAFAWSTVASFAASTDEPRPKLQIRLQDGATAGSIDAGWFAEPLPLIVAVAEAYRARRSR